MILLLLIHSWESGQSNASVDQLNFPRPLYTYEVTPFTSYNTLLLNRDLVWYIWNGRVAVQHVNTTEHYIHPMQMRLMPRLHAENMRYVGTKNLETLPQELNTSVRNNLFVWAHTQNYLLVRSMCRDFGYSIL